MTCGIYQIVNQVNGKSYIGQSRNIEKRWRQHKYGLNRETALQQGSYPLRWAFLKYGLIKFKFGHWSANSGYEFITQNQ